MNSRQYWLDRGKSGPVRVGFVCVGFGDEDFPLSDQLGVKVYTPCDEEMSEGNLGYYEDAYYYLTNNKFDELFPEESQEIPEESFVGPDLGAIAASEAYPEISYPLLHHILDCLQIGFENTEEVFILNGQRTTRSDRINAARLEQEMLMLNSCLEQLKEKVWNPF